MGTRVSSPLQTLYQGEELSCGLSGLTERSPPGFQDSDRWRPSLVLYSLGLTVKILLELSKQWVGERLEGGGPGLQTLVKIIIIYLDCLFSVVMWVGGFYTLYWLFPREEWYQLLSVLLASSITLIASRAFCSTAGTPLTVIQDTSSNVFLPASYLAEWRGAENYSLVGDILLSYTVLHTLVISSWWAMWELENNFILHECEIVIKDIQAWDSVIIAFLLSGVVFGLNRKVKGHSERGGACSTAVFYSMALLSFLASLNYWRGLWSLMDFYFFPKMDPTLNLLLCHLLGFSWSIVAGTGLTLTQSSARDPTVPEFNRCCVFSGRQEREQPSEHTPIIDRHSDPS